MQASIYHFGTNCFLTLMQLLLNVTDLFHTTTSKNLKIIIIQYFHFTC